AAPISINVGGGVSNVTTLEWYTSPVISIGGNSAFAVAAGLVPGVNCATFTAACQFDVYSHGILGSFNPSATGAGDGNLNDTYQITFEFGFREAVTTASAPLGGPNVATFAFVSGAPNYFRMYYSAGGNNANFLNGTGFTTGTLMLAGTLSPATTYVSGFTGNSTDIVDFDQFDTANWVGQQSISGGGYSSTLNISVAPGTGGYLNPVYFPGIGSIDRFALSGLGQTLPFSSIDPSKDFYWDSTGVGKTLGTRLNQNTLTTINNGINGADGTGTIFAIDTSSAISGTAIPEPTTLALIGLGVLGAGMSRHRRARG
ncbi:MAG TPA: PEP-CTERM sorting domain-containing protein, partial [Lamprocystis sp. (in: g-proteobacteria)]|nr:PEP-CTERM sorting domain-containing protein [Lamprocystis sp. (in: g-proteobacteria)]